MQNLVANTNNQFGGFDMRLIKTTPSGMTATAYAKMNENRSQLPPYLLPEEQADPSQIWHPINYTRFWTGWMASGSPSATRARSGRGLSLRANYEYHEIARSYATYPTDIAGRLRHAADGHQRRRQRLVFHPADDAHQPVRPGRPHALGLGVITYARYQMQLTQNPLYGMDAMSGAMNTNLPTNESALRDRRLVVAPVQPPVQRRAEIQIDAADSSHYANVAENNYPVLFTVWYAPTPKLVDLGRLQLLLELGQPGRHDGISRSGRTASGRDAPHGLQRSDPGGQRRWALCLVREADPDGGYFLDRWLNVFNVPASQTGANWSRCPLYSNVLAQSVRYQGGFDYKFSQKISGYFRVNVFDYQDKSQEIGTGTSFFFLGGLSGTYLNSPFHGAHADRELHFFAANAFTASPQRALTPSSSCRA